MLINNYEQRLTIILARPAPRGVVSLPHMIYKIPNHI